MSATSTPGPAAAPPVLSYEDAVQQFDPVLGLEVHVELSTATKMFCGCSTIFGAEPNSQVCPVCLGLPGSLPVLNERAVEAAMTIGLSLGCEIAEWCRAYVAAGFTHLIFHLPAPHDDETMERFASEVRPQLDA